MPAYAGMTLPNGPVARRPSLDARGSLPSTLIGSGHDIFLVLD
jgi:hypothetical protein